MLVGLPLALTLALAGCQPAPATRTIRGVIVEVQPRDLAHTDWVKLRTEDGQIFQLRVADSVDFSPGHLREHMLFEDPVTVTYVSGPDGSTATTITD